MNENRELFRAASLLFFLAFLLFPGVSDAGIRERVYETRLSNGMKIILLENHKTPLISVQIWLHTGSRNEEWGKTGLSHMLEHMMFKGSKKYSAEAFTRLLQENGGRDNAFTSEDYTAYFENLNADAVNIPLKLEADRLRNLILKEKDFRTERLVVQEERRMRTDDNPQAYLREQVDAAAFQAQPYHWPVIGWGEDIARFTLDDLEAYYRKNYTPSNAFLVVVGDFKRKELLPMIRKTFGAIPKEPKPAVIAYQDPPQTGERRVIVSRPAQLPAMVVAYHVPNLRSPDGYALEVISAILSSGKSSRLYADLVREKQLVLDVDADNPLFSVDPGLFTLTAQVFPGKKASDVEKALEDELERLRREPVGERELEKAKNQLEASFVFEQASHFSQGMMLARCEIALDWKVIGDYVPFVRKVTADDVKRVANLYLTPEKRTVGILNPLPPEPGKPAPSGPSPRGNDIRHTVEAHE